MAFSNEAQQFQEHVPELFIYKNTQVYLLDDLIEYDRASFIGCISKPRILIQKKQISPDQYFMARKRKINGQIQRRSRAKRWIESDLSVKQAKILLSEQWCMQNVAKLAGDTSLYKYKPLPALVELRDDEKFKDDQGNIYEVEVRGEKSEESIRFKGKDVENLFEMENLIRDITHNYIENEDYKIYSFDQDRFQRGLDRTGGNPTITYLTYEGLLKIIYSSKVGIAHQFRKWATHIIYTAHLGTPQEKVDLGVKLISANAQLVKNVIDTCVTNMSCVYFFIVGKMNRKAHERLWNDERCDSSIKIFLSY